ncbi:MAG TPA: hypothetical protein P5059_00640 [Candidatus Dojkabacteria bacterium]|nr:hypothetical protein [Candidatus Dojkabacteria bacterium]
MRSESYCGEIIIGKSSTGYPININPEKRVENTINGIARLIQNPNMTQEDIDYCLKVNSQRLGIDSDDLLSRVDEILDGENSEETEA